MQVYHRLEEVGLDFSGTSVAIGNFDGVHLGHQKLIQSMLAEAKNKGLVPAVLSFYPHPVEVLSPGVKLERLTTAAEKLLLLEHLGVQTVLIEKFDRALSELSPEQFLERFLAKGFRAKSVHVGANFRFGKGRAGDTAVLSRWCQAQGIQLVVEEPLNLLGDRVSSSRIRELIRTGDLVQAAQLLGRPYTLAGQVISGDGRGKQLGFPTANLRVPAEKQLPQNGVYFTRALWQRQSFLSVTNIGVRPTFKTEEPKSTVEAHLIDFSSKLYDETVELQFYRRIRDEKKFDSVDALKQQIQKDIHQAVTSAHGME